MGKCQLGYSIAQNSILENHAYNFRVKWTVYKMVINWLRPNVADNRKTTSFKEICRVFVSIGFLWHTNRCAYNFNNYQHLINKTFIIETSLTLVAWQRKLCVSLWKKLISTWSFVVNIHIHIQTSYLIIPSLMLRH